MERQQMILSLIPSRQNQIPPLNIVNSVNVSRQCCSTHSSLTRELNLETCDLTRTRALGTRELRRGLDFLFMSLGYNCNMPLFYNLVYDFSARECYCFMSYITRNVMSCSHPANVTMDTNYYVGVDQFSQMRLAFLINAISLIHYIIATISHEHTR